MATLSSTYVSPLQAHLIIASTQADVIYVSTLQSPHLSPQNILQQRAVGGALIAHYSSREWRVARLSSALYAYKRLISLSTRSPLSEDTPNF